MKQVVIVAVVLAALLGIGPKLMGVLSKPAGEFNEDGSAKIVLFTHSNCGAPCKAAEEHLAEKGAEFETRNAHSDASALQAVKGYAKKEVYPTLVVGSDIAAGFNAKQYNRALVGALGAEALEWPERLAVAEHTSADGRPRLVMYGVHWCKYCRQAKKRFEELDLDYVEWDVEKDQAARERFEALGGTGYPLIYVGARRIGTFNEREILQALSR